jgi:CRISPR-associated protein Cas2
MAQNETARYLLTYDIADPRRLGRLFRFMKKHGVPVQYSVFLVETTAAKMGSLMVKIAKMIHPSADDVRAYRLPDNGWQVIIGASILPEDVLPGGLLMTSEHRAK